MFIHHVGTYTVTMERVWGDLVDPALAVYLDPFGAFGAMTTLDSDATTPLPSCTFTVTSADQGKYFAVVVASRAPNQEGGFTFTWDLPSAEPNDDFADATVLSGTGSATGKDLNGSMPQIDDYYLGGYNFASGNHWYKIEPVSDGSLELTVDVGTIQSQHVVVWHGTVLKDLVAVGKLTYSAAPSSKIMKLPVQAGETYYVEVHGEPMYTYNIAWEINTDAPVDFQPTSTADFDTVVGATDSGGEIVCGPNDYVQQTVLPSGTFPRHRHSLYRF